MQAELDRAVSAVQGFYARDAWLLAHELNERTLAHRLAVHLERQFPDWDVDCDYSRLGERKRQLPRAAIVSTDDEFGRSIYPDIVVHHRAIPDNLLAVEIRAAGNRHAPDHDERKLRGLTDPHLWFAFRIGVGLTLGKTGITAAQVYVAGLPDIGLTDWLSARLRQHGLCGHAAGDGGGLRGRSVD